MSHPFAAYSTWCYCNTTYLTDRPGRAFTSIFSTSTYPVFCRTEETFTKKSTFLRLVRPVVECIWFGDFARAPCADLLGRCQANPQTGNGIEITHTILFFLTLMEPAYYLIPGGVIAGRVALSAGALISIKSDPVIAGTC